MTTKTVLEIATARKSVPAIVSLFETTRRCSLSPCRQVRVVGRGRDEQRRGHGRAEEREEVDVLLVGRLGEALGEGDAEQEREEHLHPGQSHAELVQELDQLPVQALLLVSSGIGPTLNLSGLQSGRCRIAYSGCRSASLFSRSPRSAPPRRPEGGVPLLKPLSGPVPSPACCRPRLHLP